VTPSITCPRCNRTSYNLHDVEQSYCRYCLDRINKVWLHDVPSISVSKPDVVLKEPLTIMDRVTKAVDVLTDRVTKAVDVLTFGLACITLLFTVVGSVCVVVMVPLGLLFAILPPRPQAALTYHVSLSQVSSDPKPTNCEWDYAPLGNKGCHYEKQVELTREPVGGSVTSVWITWNKVTE
jgi:hypothetical protein